MKTFKRYLVESQKTYNYTIKIAGEVDDKFFELFKHNLGKFVPQKIEGPKTTPIQEKPYGFEGMDNQPVHILKCEFKYPVTEPQVLQVIQLMGKGVSVNQVRVLQSDYEDGIESEKEQYTNQKSPLLMSEYENTHGKEANKDYADQYKSKVVPTKPTFDYQYSAKPTPINKPEQGKIGTTSPMSKINLPPKPKTGASK